MSYDLGTQFRKYPTCRLCGIILRQEHAPPLCPSCDSKEARKTLAREQHCPVCGVEPGYGCIFTQGMGDGQVHTRQVDDVHKARVPSEWREPIPRSQYIQIAVCCFIVAAVIFIIWLGSWFGIGK